MTGRWALLGHGLLALAIVGFVAACGGDDDDDTAAGSGGSAGSTMSGSGGSKAGSGGSAAGSGGSMAGGITADMCVANSMKETTKTAMACLTCVCGKDPKVIDAVTMDGWALIECIGEKCDGVGTDIPCITGAAPAGCTDFTAKGAATAMPTGMIFPMCKTECGIGDMPKTEDGGTMMTGGDAGL